MTMMAVVLCDSLALSMSVLLLMYTPPCFMFLYSDRPDWFLFFVSVCLCIWPRTSLLLIVLFVCIMHGLGREDCIFSIIHDMYF